MLVFIKNFIKRKYIPLQKQILDHVRGPVFEVCFVLWEYGKLVIH
jgi:hypothetical protein